MKIAALVHFMTPVHNAGSETMLTNLLAQCVRNGHRVRVFATGHVSGPEFYQHEGIDVIRCSNPYRDLTEWLPDVVLTHHQETARAAEIAEALGAKCVFLIHNDMAHTQRWMRYPHTAVVYNTEWVRRKLDDGSPSIVVHPPVFPERHRSTPGDCVTLVNLNADKGAGTFYRLAERLSHRKFLGVIGGHGPQVICRYPNLKIVPNAPDMREVWSRTRILVMPSIYESFGMVGVEAAASGIPTIAAPTPGLLESLSDSGTFVDRDDLDGWAMRIERMMQPEQWERASQKALARSNELADENTAHRFVEWLETL